MVQRTDSKLYVENEQPDIPRIIQPSKLSSGTLNIEILAIESLRCELKQ